MSESVQKRLSNAVSGLALTIAEIIQEQVRVLVAAQQDRLNILVDQHERELKLRIEQHVAEPFLTKKEVAKLLGVTPRGLDNWMKRGLLPYHKIGRTVRFKAKDVERYLDDTCRIQRRMPVVRW
jgi:excisionase family DNA binding protein